MGKKRKLRMTDQTEVNNSLLENVPSTDECQVELEDNKISSNHVLKENFEIMEDEYPKMSRKSKRIQKVSSWLESNEKEPLNLFKNVIPEYDEEDFNTFAELSVINCENDDSILEDDEEIVFTIKSDCCGAALVNFDCKIRIGGTGNEETLEQEDSTNKNKKLTLDPNIFKSIFTLLSGHICNSKDFKVVCNICDKLIEGVPQLASHVKSFEHRDCIIKISLRLIGLGPLKFDSTKLERVKEKKIQKRKLKLETEGKWTEELEARWNLKEDDRQILKSNHGQKRIRFLSYKPEEHPLYNDAWTKFWTDRHEKVFKHQTNSVDFDYPEEWRSVWTEFLNPYLKNEYYTKLQEIYARYRMELNDLKTLLDPDYSPPPQVSSTLISVQSDQSELLNKSEFFTPSVPLLQQPLPMSVLGSKMKTYSRPSILDFKPRPLYEARLSQEPKNNTKPIPRPQSVFLDPISPSLSHHHNGNNCQKLESYSKQRPRLTDLTKILSCYDWKDQSNLQHLIINDLSSLVKSFSSFYIIEQKDVSYNSSRILMTSLKACGKRDLVRFYYDQLDNNDDEVLYNSRCRFTFGNGDLIVEGTGLAETLTDAEYYSKISAKEKALVFLKQICPTVKLKARRHVKRRIHKFDIVPSHKLRIPVQCSLARKMMESMGWKEGQCLGKAEDGILEPIDLLSGGIRVGRKCLGHVQKTRSAQDVRLFRKNVRKMLKLHNEEDVDLEFGEDFTLVERKMIQKEAESFKFVTKGPEMDHRLKKGGLVLSRKLNLKKFARQLKVQDEMGKLLETQTDKFRVIWPKFS